MTKDEAILAEKSGCNQVRVTQLCSGDYGRVRVGDVFPIVTWAIEGEGVFVKTTFDPYFFLDFRQIEPYLTSVRLDVPKPNQHYQTKVQAIETMQADMTREELIGFLKGNIIKYACRCGRKDDVSKETAKIKQYAEWLDIVANGGEIVIEHKFNP